jgi:hypothetical protein
MDLSWWKLGDLLQHSLLGVVKQIIARQAITCAFMAWVESPWDSQHLFIVPRVIQRDFGRVNKHVHLMGKYQPLPLECGAQPNNVIFLLFHLHFFVRSFASTISNLDKYPLGQQPPRWVRTQAKHVHGLSPDDSSLDWWSKLVQFP